MKRSTLALLVIVILLLSVYGCKKKETKETITDVSGDVVAVAGDISVSNKELMDKLTNDPQYKAAFYKVEKQRYDFMSRVAADLLISKVLEEKAKKEGLTEDEYLTNYYKEKFSEVEGANEERLQRQLSNPRYLKMAYSRELMSKGEAKLLLVEPEVPVVEIDITGSPFKGPKGAPVTVVEFSDFQCPYCSRAVKTVEDLANKYPKDVKIVFKNMPLSFHQRAMSAAIAGVCANEQDKFWEVHDLMFQNQKKLEDADLEGYATEAGLDLDKFKKCYASEEAKKAVEEDLAIARNIGVGGTPTFYVNGKMVSGARGLDEFDQLIKQELD